MLKSKKKIYKNKLSNKLEKKKISSKDNTNNKMVNQAVILCGGLGTRLGAITKKIPKPLIKIGNKSFLDILIDRLVQKKLIRFCFFVHTKVIIFLKNITIKKLTVKLKFHASMKKNH